MKLKDLRVVMIRVKNDPVSEGYEKITVYNHGKTSVM